MFNCFFDSVIFEMVLVQSDEVWHNYEACRITADAYVLLLLLPALMCHFTVTNVFACVTCVLSVLLLPCPICPSPPPPPSRLHSLTHEYLIFQFQPQSSALWSAPRLDPVTPSMTSWSSLRSVSWKPTESKPAFFFSHPFFFTSKGWAYTSHYVILAATSATSTFGKFLWTFSSF